MIFFLCVVICLVLFELIKMNKDVIYGLIIGIFSLMFVVSIIFSIWECCKCKWS